MEQCFNSKVSGISFLIHPQALPLMAFYSKPLNLARSFNDCLGFCISRVRHEVSVHYSKASESILEIDVLLYPKLTCICL
jgi:hypothetical protein